MANAPLLERYPLPRWLMIYLSYGLSAGTDRQKRRQFTLNLFGLWGGLNSLLFSAYYVSHDLSLWPGSVVALWLSLFCFLLPFVNRFGQLAASVYSAIAIGGCFVALAFLFGARTGVYLYILIIPAGTVLATGSRNVSAVLATNAICAVQIVYSAFWLTEPYLVAATVAPFPAVMLVLALVLVLSMTAVPAYVGVFRAERAEDALEAEYARSENLLYNLLPEDIAARLKLEPDKTIADNLPNVAILFADIVDFSPRAASLPPKQVVGFLNRIFSAFDELADKHGLEKIKTIGDAYMVAAGMPSPVGDPVHRIAEMALDMQRTAKKMSPEFPEGLQVRIGLHAGPAVAGVIGNKKLFYDVWGDTVNTASRMESHGEPGRIQVTGPAFDELKEDYNFEERGTVEVKGMGVIETWWLTGKRVSA